MNVPKSPVFWRDGRMPEVELRYISDARQIAYAPHSHSHWSLGAVTGGRSTFMYQNTRYAISAGDLVLMNPHWVHACNPLLDKPWSYLMLYVDTQWASELRYRAGLTATPDWEDIATPTLSNEVLYHRYRRMAACLLNDRRDIAQKKRELTGCLVDVFTCLKSQSCQARASAPAPLQALAGYLDRNALEPLPLVRLSDYSGYSGGHLIRAFKKHYHMTPHAYVTNRRIQLGQERLKAGQSIADTALALGFNDQPHFQRTFKRLVAATPHEYRTSSIEHDEDTARG